MSRPMLAGFCLATAITATTTFAVGYWLGKRQTTSDDARHSYVMARFYLSVLKSIADKRYDMAESALRGIGRTHLTAWEQEKNTLSPAEIAELKKAVGGDGVLREANSLLGAGE